MNREKKKCPQCKMEISTSNFDRHIKGKGNTCWGDSVPILNEETKAIWGYWKEKRYRADRKGIDFKLSATEMVQLFEDAGITANDIGRHPHQYALARHNDTGDYEMGNCRFTTRRENRAEQKSTKGIPKGRRA